jgi:CP family cyanate transporter-like MFS transporter
MIVGIGVAVTGGIMPSFVREWFPSRIGAMTSVTTAVFMLGAALAAALAVPLAGALGGWPASLAVWALPAAVAAIVWVGVSLRSSATVAPAATRRPALPWRSRTAWLLSAFLAVNSLLFYSILAWLSPSYDERGWTQAEGGYLLAAATVAQIVAALAIPAVAHRMRDRRPLFAGAVAVTAAGMLLIAFAPQTATWVVVVVVSAGIGGVFTMGLVLLPELGGGPLETARLTAMAFALAYSLAALGPVLMGWLIQATGSWAPMYVVLSGVALLQLVGLAPLRPGARVTMAR